MNTHSPGVAVRRGLLPFVLLGCAASGAPLLAQTPRILVMQEDHVLSHGTVTAIYGHVVNDHGSWFALVSGDTAFDDSFLRDGFPSIREGTPVLAPSGASVERFLDLAVNARGHVGWPLQLDGTSEGNADNEGLYWNTILIAQKGGMVDAPGVSAGTVYKRFRTAKINDNDTLLAICDIDDPEIPGDTERALFRFETDGEGQVLGAEVLFKESDTVEGAGVPVVTLGLRSSSIALNNRGDWMTFVQTTGVSDEDAVIVLNDDVLVGEGGPSFMEGRSYRDLSPPSLDLNDSGDWVVSGRLSTNAPQDGLDDAVILLNGDKFVQESDVLPSIAPFSLVSFNNAPVFIGNSGDIYWYGLTTDPNESTDQAYFRNKEVIVRENDFVDGRRVTRIRTDWNAFHASPSGRFWIGEVGLEGFGGAQVINALVMADFGLVLPVPGCLGNPGTLEMTAGAAVPGATMTFALDRGQAQGVLPYLYFSTRPALQDSSCGIATGFGEVLIALGGPRVVGRFLATPWSGVTPSQVNLAIPPDPSLVDVVVHGQGVFFDLAGTAGAERVRLTNGIRVEVGAP